MLSDTLGSETLISPANPVFNSSLNFQLLFSPLEFNSPNSPCSSMTLLVGKGGFGFNSVPISLSPASPTQRHHFHPLERLLISLGIIDILAR